MTIGCEMEKPQYIENLITNNPKNKNKKNKFVVIGDPFPGSKTNYKCNNDIRPTG